MGLFSDKRNQEIFSKVPIILNAVLIVFGVFILLAMSIVFIIFEEFTAFTDYIQEWIEFNFFIFYWDKLAITRSYLSLIFIYGAVILAISSLQIHAIRKNDKKHLHLAPFLLLFIAIITLLAGLSWLTVTAVNHTEGFLATGGFIFERMRFKGNVWKDLKYREQSFIVVTGNQVPPKAAILKTWVFQRQRDFECCGWDSYLDYKLGGYQELPESCCKRKNRAFKCGAKYLTEDITATLNTRGCKAVMYNWYRRGFAANIVMGAFGILMAGYQFFVYTMNRKEFFKALDREFERQNRKFNKIVSKANSKLSLQQEVSQPLISTDEVPRIPLRTNPRFLSRNQFDDSSENNIYEEYREADDFEFEPKSVPEPKIRSNNFKRYNSKDMNGFDKEQMNT